MRETILIYDQNGQEKEYTVYFTFEANGTKFVTYFDENDPSGTVYASKMESEGTLAAITTAEEWKIVEAAFNQFQQAQMGGCGGCHGGCGGCGGDCCEGDDCDCDCNN